MIIDKLQNIEMYISMFPELSHALEVIESHLEHMEPGRFEFQNGYLLVQTGDVKPLNEGVFEAHKNYIDIQIVIRGSEMLYWNELEDLKSTTPYDETKDVAFFEGAEQHKMLITPGMFYAVFPKDGHKAIRTLEGVEDFEKIVVKLLLEKLD